MWEHAGSIWATSGEIRKIDEKDKWAVSFVTACRNWALRTEAGYIFWYFDFDTHYRTENLGSRREHRALLPHYLILQTRHANRNSGGNYWCPLITPYEIMRTKSAYVAQASESHLVKIRGEYWPFDYKPREIR